MAGDEQPSWSYIRKPVSDRRRSTQGQFIFADVLVIEVSWLNVPLHRPKSKWIKSRTGDLLNSRFLNIVCNILNISASVQSDSTLSLSLGCWAPFKCKFVSEYMNSATKMHIDNTSHCICVSRVHNWNWSALLKPTYVLVLLSSRMVTWHLTVMRVRNRHQRPWLDTFPWGDTLLEYQTKGKAWTWFLLSLLAVMFLYHVTVCCLPHSPTHHVCCSESRNLNWKSRVVLIRAWPIEYGSKTGSNQQLKFPPIIQGVFEVR